MAERLEEVRKLIALLIIILISIPSLHLLGFRSAFPSSVRHFFDLTFFTDLSGTLVYYLTISGFISVYVPKAIIGFSILAHDFRVDRIYGSRGYNTAYAPFSVRTPKGAGWKDAITELQRTLRRAKNFSRPDARFLNFKRRKLSNIIPLELLHRHRLWLSCSLGAVVFCILYLGFTRSFILLPIATIVFLGLHAYDASGSGYLFSLDRAFWSNYKRKEGSNIDLSIAMIAAAALAVTSFLSGHLRADYIRANGSTSVLGATSERVTVIGPNSNGLLVLNSQGNTFSFVSFSAISTVDIELD
ncbi:hypothetical protein [Gemmobacter nectariphilus]|uniref:hypothetical protein n=1 Tax=Gemmobacter nectariphilus TaxID=220343 RepID=UPI0012B566A0|nr:hypothetical protein [Gemmobacter nectariphilus]